VSPLLCIQGRRSLAGWPAGTSIDSQDTLSFSVLYGVTKIYNDTLLMHIKERGSNEYETELNLAEAFAKRGDTVGATLRTFVAQKISDLLNTLAQT
jgi:hypothetical protein